MLMRNRVILIATALAGVCSSYPLLLARHNGMRPVCAYSVIDLHLGATGWAYHVSVEQLGGFDCYRLSWSFQYFFFSTMQGMRFEDTGLRIIIDLHLGNYQGRPMQYHVSVEQLKEPENA